MKTYHRKKKQDCTTVCGRDCNAARIMDMEQHGKEEWLGKACHHVRVHAGKEHHENLS